jgi:hypothetical protein
VTDPLKLIQTTKYRNYLLQMTQAGIQWEVSILPTDDRLPSLPIEKQTVRGWEEDEILQRAKRRVDELLEGRHSN